MHAANSAFWRQGVQLRAFYTRGDASQAVVAGGSTVARRVLTVTLCLALVGAISIVASGAGQSTAAPCPSFVRLSPEQRRDYWIKATQSAALERKLFCTLWKSDVVTAFQPVGGNITVTWMDDVSTWLRKCYLGNLYPGAHVYGDMFEADQDTQLEFTWMPLY